LILSLTLTKDRPMYLTIDPGIATGWALWSAVRLLECGLGTPPARADLEAVWIESPVIYPHSRARPNDILKLARDAGAHAGLYLSLGVNVRFVEPARWKGQVPKTIHHARVWSQLQPGEQSIVHEGCLGVAPSKRHNVLDAVGMGLWVRSQAKFTT
jgi:hypothetical protein